MAAVVRPDRLSGVKVAAGTAAPLAAAAGRGWDIAGAAYWTWAAAATAAPLAAAGQGWDIAEAAYWTWAAASLSIQRAVLSEDEEGSEQDDYQKAEETEY